MNKFLARIIFAIFALVCSINISNAQNSISAESLSLKPGATAELKIDMTNNVDVCSFQFNIKLPDGVTVVKELNEDEELVEAISLTSRKKSSHDLTFKKTEDGSYFLLAYSLSNATFRDSSGAIVTMKVKAAEGLAEGNKDIVISNILLVTPTEEKLQPANTTGHITISENGEGDASGSDDGDNSDNSDIGNNDGGSSEIGSNAFYIPSTTLNAGTQQTLYINLKNENEITAFQFDLTLPSGITVNTMLNDDEEQMPNVQLTSRKKSKHQLSCIQQEDGSYRIVVISMSNQTFRDNDGAIVAVNVTASSIMSSGSYYAKLSNIHIVSMADGAQGERIDQPDYTSNINVNNASEGSDADTKLYISTDSLVAGGNGQNIEIALSNSIDVTAFQFDITLPKGMTIENYLNDDDETVPNVQLSPRKKSSHSISCNYRGDNRYTVVVLSMKNQAFEGNDGNIVSIKVIVPLSISGNQQITLNNIHVVPLVNDSQGIRIDQTDVTHNIYISNQGGGNTPTGDNTITVEPLSIGAGETGVLNIIMDNEDDICSFQFNIKLPDGVSIIKEYNEDDEYVESINLTSRKKSSHELSFKQTEDGGYFIIAYSLSNSTFRNNSGAIVSIKVKADTSMQDGNYGVVLSNVLMVTPDERKIEQESHNGTLTITSEVGIDDVLNEGNIHITLVGTTIVIDGLPQSGYVELYNTSGQKLAAEKGNEGKTTIDCSAYKNHTIIVKTTNSEGIKTKKFNL
ncbi:MAG: hypothetical protein IIW93_07070 [Bacteroidaceae bacterium]|nr:hypothetical protein [Bacteroidaceae bacterium]